MLPPLKAIRQLALPGYKVQYLLVPNGKYFGHAYAEVLPHAYWHRLHDPEEGVVMQSRPIEVDCFLPPPEEGKVKVRTEASTLGVHMGRGVMKVQGTGKRRPSWGRVRILMIGG